MSRFEYDPDWYEPVYESRTCTVCCGDLRRCTGGCNGMASFGMKLRTPEVVATIKAERLRKEEDEVLARADAIRAKRNETLPNGNKATKAIE